MIAALIILAIGLIACVLIGPVAGMTRYLGRYERKEVGE